MLSSALSCAGPRLFGSASKVAALEVDGWRELRSPDFVLYSRGPEESLQVLALDLARYVAVAERLVQSQPPKKIAAIFLVKDRAAKIFIPNPRFAGYMGHSLAGFVGFMRSGTHDPSYRNLLLHEFSHYLNLRGSELNYPNWYKEGFAEFMGSTRTREDVMEIGSAPPQNLHQLALRRLRKEEIDLSEIFAFERGVGTRDPDDFYPISWAVVHYLSSNTHRRERMLAMLKDQANGLDWRRAYDRSFSEPIEILSKRVSHHAEMLSRGTPGAVAYIPLDALDVHDEWEIREISPNAILRLLGDAALRGVVYTRSKSHPDLRLAEALFRRALEFNPDDSDSRAGLAATLARQSSFDGAEFQLALFRKDPEPSVAAIVYAADSIRMHAIILDHEAPSNRPEKRHAVAIRLYQRALASKPDNPSALAGIGHSQLETQDFEAARRSLAAAEIAGEWDADLTLNQGRVERGLGNLAKARSLWKEVIRLGTENDARRAADLLAQIESD